MILPAALYFSVQPAQSGLEILILPPEMCAGVCNKGNDLPIGYPSATGVSSCAYGVFYILRISALSKLVIILLLSVCVDVYMCSYG